MTSNGPAGALGLESRSLGGAWQRGPAERLGLEGDAIGRFCFGGEMHFVNLLEIGARRFFFFFSRGLQSNGGFLIEIAWFLFRSSHLRLPPLT